MSDRAHRWASDAGKLAGGRVTRGLDLILGDHSGGRFGILYYHRVTERPPGTPSPTLNVTPRSFHRQIAGLLDRGYRFATVGAILELVDAGEPVPSGTAVITFDDGFRGVHDHAWPIVRKLGVPVTVFVATSFLDSERPFPFDRWGVEHAATSSPGAWAPLTWAQCREMLDSGLVEIGSHTHTHADLRGRPDEFREDLATSLDAIRDRLEVNATSFSFPFGSVRAGFAGEDLAAEARRLGVRCGLTTEIELVDLDTSPFRWGRFEAVGSDTGATLAAKLHGWYSWMGWGRRVFRAVAG